jgi:hypothetical protein
MNVFLAYAPEDELLKNELEEHLSLLQKQGAITVWNAGKIAPGEDISVRTAEQIRAARLILLLISSDFLASDLTEHPDIKNALAQQRINKQVCVIPIVIRDCVWRVGELAHLKPLPSNGHAITNTKYWANRDEAFKQVAVGLQKVVADLQGKTDDYPSGKLTETVTDIGTTFWQQYRQLIGSNIVAALILVLTGLVIYQAVKNRDIFERNRYRKQLEGTWVHLQYFQDVLLIAKLVFREGEVEVYSKDKGRELYWGKQEWRLKDGRIDISYPNWDISLQIEPQSDGTSKGFGSLVTIYSLKDAEPGWGVVNDTLVRPLTAIKKQVNMSVDSPTQSPTSPQSPNGGKDTLVINLPAERNPIGSSIYTSPPNKQDTTSANGQPAPQPTDRNDTIIAARPVLKAFIDKMNDSTAARYYNPIMPAETLSVSPLHRLDGKVKKTRKLQK